MSKLYDLVVIDMDANAMVIRIPAKFQKYWNDFFGSHQGTWSVKCFKVKDYVGNLEVIPPASHYMPITALAKTWLDIQYERVDCFYYSEFVEFCGDFYIAAKILNSWRRTNPKAINKIVKDSDCIMFGDN
jgi:hypothetical protein